MQKSPGKGVINVQAIDRTGPHQFVIRCRVERAKELLMRGDMPIADIATEVGFANQSHLTRHFKRITGVTPKLVLESSKNVPSAARA